MARKPSRNEWRQSKSGLWTRSLGDRGARCRLFQKRRDGVFYLAWWEPHRGMVKESTKTGNKAEADRLGREKVAELLSGEEGFSTGRLPLSYLWKRYESDSVSFECYSDRMKKEVESRVQILTAFFGAECDVRTLTEEDQLAFAKKRIAGGIVIGKDKGGKDRITPKVRPRSAQADAMVLRSMLHWATTFRIGSGMRLLDRNPLAGVKLPSRGSNPRRPVATVERFTATRKAIVELQAEASFDCERRKWLKLEAALVIAEATGRRLGSIRQLAWQDIDFHESIIVWHAASDKMKKDWRVPMSEKLRDELKAFRLKMGSAFGGLVFPSERDPSIPVRRDTFGTWLLAAERKAGLPKLDGSLWHAFRRAWASSKKHLPAVDSAAVCGMSVRTMIGIYQQADHAGMQAVVNDDRKLSEQVKTG